MKSPLLLLALRGGLSAPEAQVAVGSGGAVAEEEAAEQLPARRNYVPTDQRAPTRTRQSLNAIAGLLNSLIRQGILVQKPDGDWTLALTAQMVFDALGFEPMPCTTQVIAGPGLVGGGPLTGDVILGLQEVKTKESVSLDPVPANGEFTVDQYGRVIAVTGGVSVP